MPEASTIVFMMSERYEPEAAKRTELSGFFCAVIFFEPSLSMLNRNSNSPLTVLVPRISDALPAMRLLAAFSFCLRVFLPIIPSIQ